MLGQNIVPSAGGARNVGSGLATGVNNGQYKPAITNISPTRRQQGAGQFPYTGAGYAQIFIDGPRNAVGPAMSPALDTPAAQVPGSHTEPPNRQEKPTELRFDQYWSGHQNSMLIWPSAHGPAREYQTTAPSRWPGQPALLPRLFAPNLGGLGGVAQRGFHQDQGRKNGLYHLNPMWALRQLASARTTNQKLNRMAGAVAIPSVFVPTSPSNFSRGRGSY